MTRDHRTVAVTGLGAVTPWGWSVAELWNGLLSGGHRFHPVTRFDPAGHRTSLAGEVPARTGVGDPHHSLADRYAVAAAREAIADSGIAAGHLERAGVFFGSSTGGMLESEAWYERATRPGSVRAPLSWLVAQQYNAPGDAVARTLGTHGPVESVSSACTSGTLALGSALDAVASGEVDVALAGGSDSLCQLTYAGFNSLRAVDPKPCRPFRGDRAGLNLGEGAAVLVLEVLDAALARGRRPWAVLSGFGSSCDAYHMTAPKPDGSGAAAAIRQALGAAGIGAGAIDLLNAHGTGTPLNDIAEWHSFQAVFGERAREIPMAATKGSIGHFLGAAGAVEALTTVLCLHHRVVHPIPGGGTPDPEIEAHLVLDSPRPIPRATWALTVNLAFGGSNAALVIRREGDE